ncbi:uncharacterized protein LOC113467674 [Diaphorina citri]|uniref:Uncharacterized protein LOC113467674 n=1 Tax=Diaphorina citri TaxID=121845 RepID=A0A3Q0IYP4_DIACI|nr:uncharacterized protein LOC113467674 [Diaphorina citri]
MPIHMYGHVLSWPTPTSTLPSSPSTPTPWSCPSIKNDLCACDLPHTLRCTANKSDLYAISESLRGLEPDERVSLLDCTLSNVTVLPEKEMYSYHNVADIPGASEDTPVILPYMRTE